MDKIEQYRQIIRDVLTPFTVLRYSNADITNEAVFDGDHDRYVIISVGWQGQRRIQHCLIHLDIINGKVWIQRDNTEVGVAYALEEAGIPKSDIVLGFQPADVRPFTDYAVA
jgi:hypothetical protein